MAEKLTIVYRPLSDLIPYARNSRTHSDEQVAEIAASMREFGFTNPVLIDEKGIIAGHGRVKAARKLGMTEVPTITLAGLTDAQRRAYVIADNRIALNAGWDLDMLKVEIAELKAEDFDLTLLGFGTDELAKFLVDPTEGLTDPDEVPETPAEPVSREGDVWILGNHRLMCGDATRDDHVRSLLGHVKPHLMVTDPPYGVEYDPAWRGEAKNADGSLLSTGKGRAKGKVENDDKADWREAWALFPGDVAYVWHAMLTSHTVAGSLMESGFQIRAEIVWSKSNFVVGRGHYHPQHESCWYAVRKTATGHWAGDRKQSTIWSIEKPKKSETGHGTQKPVECMKRPIENNSSPGQAVYEPFSGSGTTIIAAEMTGRMCFAMEISPAYVDVGLTRWADFTGKAAILEATGQTYIEVMAERNMAANVEATVKPAKAKRGKANG